MIVGLILVCVTAILCTLAIRHSGKKIRYDVTNQTFHAFDTSEAPGMATWVTSCNADYVDGVMKLHASLRRVGSKYPLLCFCTDTTTPEQERRLQQTGIRTQRIRLSELTNPYKHKWLEAFVKLECWNLTAYDKVCWIDSDTIQLQNCDELMHIPLERHGIACAIDHEVFPELTDRPHFRMLQTGVIVLRPAPQTFEFLKAHLGKVASADGGDQGFLTSVYALDGFRNVRFLSSAYNYGKRGLKRHAEFDLSKIKILHFVGHPKPWNGGEDGYEMLQDVWDRT